MISQTLFSSSYQPQTPQRSCKELLLPVTPASHYCASVSLVLTKILIFQSLMQRCCKYCFRFIEKLFLFSPLPGASWESLSPNIENREEYQKLCLRYSRVVLQMFPLCGCEVKQKHQIRSCVFAHICLLLI